MEHDDERQPDTGTAAMSEEDPERTRLGAHLEEGEATYTGEEDEVTGREHAGRPEPPDRDEPYRADRPGGGGSPLFADEEDRPPPADQG